MATIRELRAAGAPHALALRNLVRRLKVSLTKAIGRWQLLGFRGVDGEQETFDDVEVFQGIGFASRPAAGGRPEAVVVHVRAEGGHPVIIATRDKTTQPELDEDETQVSNSQVRLKMTAAGEILADDGGGAVELATKADVQRAIDYLKKQFDPLAGHVHATPSGPTTTITEATGPAAGGTAPSPTGTTVFKAK
jgi:phage gp45-like